MNWPTCPLSDVADFVLGKMLDQAKNKGELRPYLANINVRWGAFDLADLRQMRFEDREIERYSLQRGDIVMCEGGEPGRCALWRGAAGSMMVQKALHRIRPHVCLDNTFLYYQFLDLGTANGFAPYFTGATIKHLPREQLAKVLVRIPDLPTQHAIAFGLTSYDDLIATNQRRITLLEEAARRLYREWFVHLRFPGHELDQLYGGVPHGWKKSQIADMTTFLNRGVTPKYDESASGLVINQKCVREGRLSVIAARRHANEVKPDRQLQVGDILINSTGAGTLGRVAQVRAPIGNCTVDTHITIARPSSKQLAGYLGQDLLAMEATLAGMGKGATNQLELSRSDIGAIKVWQPSVKLLADFSNLVWPMLELAEHLLNANQHLLCARNLLLPKLMSGQLDVSRIPLPEEATA